MCVFDQPERPQLAPPPPPPPAPEPEAPPKVMLTPDEEKRRSADTTAASRRATRNPLRLRSGSSLSLSDGGAGLSTPT